MGGQASGIIVSDHPLPVFAGVRAVLDFTTTEATVAHAEIAAQAVRSHTGAALMSSFPTAVGDHHIDHR